MRLALDLPEDVFGQLMTLAVHEHRHTAQQATYILTRWVRHAQKKTDEDDKSLEPTGVVNSE